LGLRIGIIRTWDSRWFARKGYSKLVVEDAKIRSFLKKKLYHAGISRIEIERAADQAKIRIHTARPGIVIGKKGAEIEALKRQLAPLVRRQILIDIQEVRKPELDATLVAENIALQLTRRVAFRRAMKKAVGSALKFGAKGVRVACSGRLGGAEMAHYEWYREGRAPAPTLRAAIDYGRAVAKTTYGIIGVKVWIFKGEVLN